MEKALETSRNSGRALNIEGAPNFDVNAVEKSAGACRTPGTIITADAGYYCEANLKAFNAAGIDAYLPDTLHRREKQASDFLAADPTQDRLRSIDWSQARPRHP